MGILYKSGAADNIVIPGLISQADTKLLITNPTIAVGDFKIWNPGGAGSWDNLATTPTALSAAGTAVLVSWNAAEAAYSPFVIVWQDAAGGQWCSGGLSIRMGPRDIADLAYPTTTGRSIDVLATGEVGIDWGNIANQNNTATLSDTTIKAVTNAVTVGAVNAAALAQFFTVNSGQTGAGAVAGSVVHEIGHAVLAIGTIFPAGAINYTYTLTDSVTLLPIQGADVWFSTDVAGLNIIWKGVTDVFGVARDVLGNLPALDAGNYFVWSQRAGYAASAFPDAEAVP